MCQPLLLLIVSLISISVLTTTGNKEISDEVALRAFRSQITRDPHGVFNSWNDSHHFCEWEGLTCGRKHKRVTVLDLGSRNLYGTLSPYIGNLSFLKQLWLHNNTIQGYIPSEFGNLLRLEYLYLHNNSLTGELPANLSQCTRLKSVYIANNHLVGRIPPQFVSLHNFSGGIPSFLGNLSSLEFLYLANNPLGGSIPESFGQLKNLKRLLFHFDDLSGTIPLSIFNITSLSIFNVAGNHLEGSLPSLLGSFLPNLEILQLSRNLFSGTIPLSLSNCSGLQDLEIAENNFWGKLNIDFGEMQNLRELGFGTNNLGTSETDDMKFINSLTNCTNLKVLGLEQNQFKSMLPPSIVNLSNGIEIINLGSNQLRGNIPTGIDNLVNLNALSCSYNQFTGPIPVEIGSLHNLRILGLAGNQLTGEIPSSMGNLSLLLGLGLGSNKLSGNIPSSLANLKQLNELYLYQNNLNGTIPPELFQITSLSIYLDLSDNHLVGSIPENVGNMKALTALNVSHNNFSGEIPIDLGGCSSLEYLYMQGNILEGSIPKSFDSLKGIRELDLSSNNLSGEIPKFLEKLHLEKLNLSFNHFRGQVPKTGVFSNSSAISIMGNGNNNLCGGIVELHLSTCRNDTSKKHKVASPSFKILISIAVLLLCVAVLSLAIFFWLRRRRRREPIFGSMWGKTLPKVSYQMLHRATDGFSPTHLIGTGSFGSVYKGILGEDCSIVAIKVLNLQRQGASKSFISECKALKSIRHRNLVKVISCCASIDFQGYDFKAIVYEFMANGNLEKWLHHTSEAEDEQMGTEKLSFLQRLNITIGVAFALDYLHNHCKDPILHCDLKPSNVLLDTDMIVHVGDFGLVKFLPKTSISNESSTIGVKGTIGYTAPEYGLGSEVSSRGDVYSFGILLLEIFTKKKPTDQMFEGDLNLHSYARNAFPDNILDILDPELINEEVTVASQRMRKALDIQRKECLISMVRIGIACSLESPQDRMNIAQVVNELQKIKNILLQPTTSLNK